MNNRPRLWLLAWLLLTGVFSIAGHAAQPGGRPPGPPPSEPSRPVRRSSPRTTRPTTAPRRGVGSLSLRAHPSNCAVTLNGRQAGTTDAEGRLRLNSLTPGRYVLMTGRENYQTDQRTIEIEVGRETLIELSLIAFPGTLDVTPDVTGALITISNVGEFVGQVRAFSIAPGVYRITVSKPGYQSSLQTVEVRPGAPASVAISLQPLPLEQALADAERRLRSGDYATAISICEVALTVQPDNLRAKTLLGYSHYYARNFDQSLVYLLEAIAANQSIEIPVKRAQRASRGDGLCGGRLTLRRGSFEFRSSECAGVDFSAAANGIYDIRAEARHGGRIYLNIGGIQNSGRRTRRERIYLHPSAAIVSADGRNRINCADCQQELQYVLRLIQQTRQ